MKYIFCIFIISLGLFSCSPQARLARLLRKHPELVRRDTIWKKDTVTVFGTRTDTVFKFFQRDTVIIKKDQLTMKYYFREDSTVYLEGKCDTVQIIREIPVVVNDVKGEAPKGFWQKLYEFVPWLAVILLLVAFIINKARNK